jgi:hypothetical protein
VLRRLATLTIAALALALPSAASADGWGTLRELSAPGQDAFSADVATDSTGNATTVWSRSDGTNFIVQSRRIAADGSLGPVRDLSLPGATSGQPHVAVDAAGNAIAGWIRNTGTAFNPKGVVQARRIAPDGTLGPIQDLSPAGRNANVVDLVVDPAGNATAAWDDTDFPRVPVRARRIAADGTLGPTLDLSVNGDLNPVLAVDPAGNVTAIWRHFAGANDVVQTRRIAPDGSLSPVRDMTPSGERANNHDLAVDPSGNVLVVWQLGGGSTIIQARRIAADGGFGPTLDLTASDEFAIDSHVAIDPSGRATVGWVQTGGVVKVRRIAPDGALGPTGELAATGNETSGPVLAVDAAGEATAAWNTFTGSIAIIQARRIAPDESLGPIEDLDPGRDAHEPAVASDPAGDATVVWSGSNGTNRLAKARQFLRSPRSAAATTTEAVVGPSGPPPLIVGPTTGRAVAALLGKTLRFKRGKANESVRCDNVAGDQCALSATLTTGRGSAARKKRKPKPKTLARAAATIAGGQTAKITWRLTAAGRKALRRKRVTATLAGTSRNRAGEAVTVTGRRTLAIAPAKKKRRKR